MRKLSKYLKKDFSLFDMTVLATDTKKMEFTYIEIIIFRSIEKAIVNYEPLLFLGCPTETREKINKYKNILDKWNKDEVSKNRNVATDNFIKDYKVDIQEIDNHVLKIISKSFEEKKLGEVA